MNMNVLFAPSTRKGKKMMGIFYKDDEIRPIVRHFGSASYSDYTTHHDPERRERYRKRHNTRFIHDPTTPASLSWHILWGPTTDIITNIREYKKKFNLN